MDRREKKKQQTSRRNNKYLQLKTLDSSSASVSSSISRSLISTSKRVLQDHHHHHHHNGIGIMKEASFFNKPSNDGVEDEEKEDEKDMIGLILMNKLNQNKIPHFSTVGTSKEETTAATANIGKPSKFRPLICIHNIQKLKRGIHFLSDKLRYQTIQNMTISKLFDSFFTLLQICLCILLGVPTEYGKDITLIQTLDATLSFILLYSLTLSIASSFTFIGCCNVTFATLQLFIFILIDVDEFIIYCCPNWVKQLCLFIKHEIILKFESELMFVKDLQGRSWSWSDLHSQFDTHKDQDGKFHCNVFAGSKNISVRTCLHQKALNYALDFRMDSLQYETTLPTAVNTTTATATTSSSAIMDSLLEFQGGGGVGAQSTSNSWSTIDDKRTNNILSKNYREKKTQHKVFRHILPPLRQKRKAKTYQEPSSFHESFIQSNSKPKKRLSQRIAAIESESDIGESGGGAESYTDSDSSSVNSTTFLQNSSASSSYHKLNNTDLHHYQIQQQHHAVDINWLDVGTRLGIQILKSEPVKRLIDENKNKRMQTALNAATPSSAYSTPAKELDRSLISSANATPEPSSVRRPVHPVWGHYRNNSIPDNFLTSSTPLTNGQQNESNFSHDADFLSIPQIHFHSLEARDTLKKGIKMSVPLMNYSSSSSSSNQIIGTVTHCERIFVSGFQIPTDHLMTTVISSTDESTTITKTNCLSIRLLVDYSFLRNGKFATIHLRIPDEYPHQYFPRHSAFPIGSCVATSFGIGILVGWREYDDMHVIRSLWRKRGSGSGLAYLHRSALHDIVEAAVGLEVHTALGKGIISGYVNGGKHCLNGRYVTSINETCRHQGVFVELLRKEIISCPSAKLIPVLAYIREAVDFQIQYDSYQAALDMRESNFDGISSWENDYLKWSEGVEIIFGGFVKAVQEIGNFDREVNRVINNIILFLERLDLGKQHFGLKESASFSPTSSFAESVHVIKQHQQLRQEQCHQNDLAKQPHQNSTNNDDHIPGLWVLNNIFGGIFVDSMNDVPSFSSNDSGTSTSDNSSYYTNPSNSPRRKRKRQRDSYTRAFTTIHLFLRTLTIARIDASSSRPNLQLGLSICHEFLLFIRTILKIRQKNVSDKAAEVRTRTWKLLKETLLPIQDCLSNIGRGIEERLQQHGAIARARFTRFFDLILHDERLLHGLDFGDWDLCISRLERALIKSRILDNESCARLRKSAFFIFHALAPRGAGGGVNDWLDGRRSGNRTNKKLLWFAKALKWLATPRRSFLKIFKHDFVLEIIERILVRVYRNNAEDCQTINIYASTFHSFHHLMLLRNVSIAGKLWTPLLDAADEEFTFAVSKIPDNDMREIGSALSKLFSLGVANIRVLMNSESPGDWLDFLVKEEAVELIQKLDMKLVLSIETLCKEIKNTMVALPYYPSIDQDILNLIDEVDLKVLLKETSEAILDKNRLLDYLREKCQLAIDRFLNYLPKMSIPVEKRGIGNGWVITCRSSDGSPLRLSQVSLCRDNMVCQVIGSDNLFTPVTSSDDRYSSLSNESETESNQVYSVLDDVKELVLNAQRFDCWIKAEDAYQNPLLQPEPLKGIPLSDVLSCAIDLWKNLEIDDEELLEIAVRDVSSHIQKKDESIEPYDTAEERYPILTKGLEKNKFKSNVDDDFEFFPRLRFNPRVDPTVLFLAIRDMTICLDDFIFRVELKEKKSIMDPVFEGAGTLTVSKVSIKLRVECRKEQAFKSGEDYVLPVLQLQELDVRLGSVEFRFKESGLGWFFNSIVEGFSDAITEVVEVNLKEQIINQIHDALGKLNSVIEGNPELFLGILGISINDLEENLVWV